MGRTLLTNEQVQSREEVADQLQNIVDRLRAGDTITLQGGNGDVTLDPSDRVEFEVIVEEESAGDMSLEIELEWNGAAAEPSDELEIS